MNAIRLIRADASRKHLAFALWRQVFGDDPAMIEGFFEAAPFEKTCFMALSGEAVAGMLFSLPAVLTVDGKAIESRYIYAVATAPEYRKRGIMTALEAFACEEARREGAEYTALVPADKSLFAMYKRLGYRTAFFQRTAKIPKRMRPQAKLAPCSRSAFLAYRREFLAEHSVSFELYPSMCAFRYEDLLKGGQIVLATTLYGQGYLAFEKAGDTLRIHETSLAGEALSHAASAVCEAECCKTITVKGMAGTAVPFGMVKPLFKEKQRNFSLKIDGYMGLMLN